METKTFDAVIVGAGIGGVVAAALLAHKGYKTLLVEKAPALGGRFGAIKQEGFTMPAGAIAIHYKNTAIDKTWNEVGAKFEFIDVPNLYYRIAGKDHLMPAKGSISAGLDIINKLAEDKVKLLSGFAQAMSKETVMNAFRVGIKGQQKDSVQTFKDWLLQYTDNELAHGIFDTITNSLCGAHAWEIPASSVFSFFTTMGGNRDVGVSPHGNLANLENLAKTIPNNGGEVWLNAKVSKINVQGGNAHGLIVEKDGAQVQVDADFVICDAGVRACVEMAGAGNFAEAYLRDMRLKLRPHPITMVYLATNRPLWPDDGSPAVQMLVGARRITSLLPLTSIAPDLSPKGQHLTFLFGGPPSNECHMDKEVELAQCMKDIKENFPVFNDGGRVLKVLSKDIDDELPEGRSKLGSMMPMETPVKNLFNIGDACCPFGFYGSTGAAETGRLIIDVIKKKYKPSQPGK